ncbi:MAG: DNA double-strand break repair nuclease NurA [Ignisphaera sp.]
MENHLNEVIEEVIGVSPEIVDKALNRTIDKLYKEVSKIIEIGNEIRRAIESRGSFTIKLMGRPIDLCYYTIDSSFTAPAIELIGGYLSIAVVSYTSYGKTCGKTGIESRAYVDLNFVEDLTSIYAKYYERRTALELLNAKKRGEVNFEVLLLDGEIIPRILPSWRTRESKKSRLFQLIINITEDIMELADRTDTAIVGILKRSYSRDIVNILGFKELKMSDRAILSLVLKPGEYIVFGSYVDLRDELLKLRARGDADDKWLRARIPWYDGIVQSMAGHTVKLAFYRAEKTIHPTATKMEYVTSSSLDEDTLISSIMKISVGTGIPIPIDYTDALSDVSGSLKYTIYQKMIAELSKKLANDSDKVSIFLSLMNPEKMGIVIYRLKM